MVAGRDASRRDAADRRGEEERRQDRRHAEHPADLRGSALAVIQWFAFSRYEVTLTVPARPCTIQRAPRMISSVSSEDRSSVAPHADYLADRLSGHAHVLGKRYPPGGVSSGQVVSGRRAPRSWPIAVDRRR